MAMSSKMSAARRIDERRRQFMAAPQGSSRGAAQRGAAHAAGPVARQPGDPSYDGARGPNRAAETQAAIDERLSDHLDAIVNATLKLSREEQRGVWRRFLSALGGRSW